MADVANFLSECFHKGLEYSTLNSYRSAISAFHPEVEGFKVGQHPVVRRIMLGAFNERPPKPRYSSTWDVNKVLEYFMSQEDELSLKEITLKLTMLIALTTASRGSEIRALNPLCMSDKGDVVEFQLDRLTKSYKAGRPSISVTLHAYKANQKLDVVACLRRYLSLSEKFRLNKEQKQQLLLSFIKPYKPIVTCSVARWLKAVMSGAGIDTSVYKAHSTRSAATSKAKTLGISTEEIMQKANWSRASTFHKFYCKDKDPKSLFQTSVLSLQK